MVSSGFEDIIEQCKKTSLAEVTKNSLNVIEEKSMDRIIC
jgi:hypothetical protein